MLITKAHVTMCLAAAATCVGAYAGDHGKPSHDQRARSSRMQPVAVTTKPGEPAHGWQYFSDARHGRAVVISPGGDYYYSQGDGLMLVFQAGSGASAETRLR